jgi:uncharacterized cupredoxin-like copper-binding protein
VRRAALPLTTLVAAGAFLLAGCGGETAASDEGTPPPSTAAGATTTTAGGEPAAGRRGFEVGLAEWRLDLESRSVEAGRVTFVITNRGSMPHGFEIEREEDDSGGDKAETRFLEPGETTRVRVDLRPGVYKVECNVEGHDDLGMEALLEVG